MIQARGSGDIVLQLEEGGLITTINATVVDALLNRSNIDNVVSERLRLEAFGALLINGEEDGGQFDVDGDISLLLLETTDVDGVRVLQHTQIEAIADMVLLVMVPIQPSTRTLNRLSDGKTVTCRS